ncbi:AraC family transcriptional regulator [uncultured Maribacter sp.]|uniref:AraC family transcriptional regulator n=1 Tax=uncultured Maribacter sp. TaxID=431308 RepID=UPI0026136AE2|nr:AraC family transcriptional regulator [uncultured Maribacter sp.]
MMKYCFFFFFLFSGYTILGQDSARIKAVDYAKLSEFFYKKGDNEKHKLYTDSLLHISEKHKLADLELLAIMNQGVYYKNTNQLKKALSTYLIVLEKCERVPNSQKNKIMTMVNMGNIYNRIKDANKAIYFFKKALPLIEKYPNNGYIKAGVYSGLGKANSILNNFDASFEYQYKLKHLGDSLQNIYLQVTALTDISDLFNKKKDYINGLKIGKQALQLNSTFNDSILQKDMILLNIGLSHKGLKKMEMAKTFFNKAKRVAIDKKNDKIEMQAEKYLADIYEQLKDFEASQKSQKRFLELNTQYIEDQKETAVLDVEKEAEEKIKTVNEKSETRIHILSTIFILLLIVSGGFSLFYRKRKRQIIKQNKQLQDDYRWLQNQNASLKENIQQLSKEKSYKENSSKKYKNSSLKKQDREQYMNRVLEYMEVEKPYLDFDLTQSGLAKKMEINTHHLSEVLTLSFEQNFYNFINIYRIDHAQKMLKNPEFKNYKIEAIAYDSGFKSKASFNRVFKNVAGKTPSEYRKS